MAAEPRGFDVIIVGAGSVGSPAALSLAEAGLKVLVVDAFASPGQGANKAAIGGVRATHSDAAKIRLCLKSLEVFSTWKERYGDDVEWHQGGYCFVAYRDKDEATLKGLLKVQKAHGLDIRWLGAEELLKTVPDLRPDGLIGGTFSPGDGSVSSMLATHASYRQAKRLGAQFRFEERVVQVLAEGGRVRGVRTDKGTYLAPVVINAAGPQAREVARMAGTDVPVAPDSHEAGVTEPVARFLGPMVVDIRPAEGSANYYFYQHRTGQIIFCITPSPAIVGIDRRETSEFLPMISRRMLGIMPKLKNIKVRRTWRGLYPMTPDGSPLVGRCRELEGFILAAGMCGQGLMLGPGLGGLLRRLVTDRLEPEDKQTLDLLSPYRAFAGVERLK
ncbi:MAG: FAD-binding oxidoreductase [Elusimicrobiota bacterium]